MPTEYFSSYDGKEVMAKVATGGREIAPNLVPDIGSRSNGVLEISGGVAAWGDNEWVSSEVTINKYYPPDILYYTNFEDMTGLSTESFTATDVPIIGNTTTYTLSSAYASRPALSTLTYGESVLPCMVIDYSNGWEDDILGNTAVSTAGLEDFTTECIIQFSEGTGVHVYISFDGTSAASGIQIGQQSYFGKPLDVYIPTALQSTISVYNGASKNEPDRIAIPVTDFYAAHKHQIYYNRAGVYWEYWCDNVRYIRGTTLPSWIDTLGLKLRVINGGREIPIKLAQFALTAGRKTELLYN